jgi:hypothetical protein
MADMPEQATVPNSYFEVNMDYTAPSAKIWVERVLVVQDMFDAFQPWNMSIDDMEVITSGKPSEQGLRFKFPGKAATFFVGLASCKFTRDNTSWETAGETIAILDSALTALIKAASIEIKNRKVLVALHVQPKTSSFAKFLAPLISPKVIALQEGEFKTGAVVVQWPGRKVTFDGSSYISNGIFIRLERDFGADVSYEKIQALLMDDEEKAFELLELDVN